MATFYADNYKAGYQDKPSSKYPKGEFNGKRKVQIDRFTLVNAAGTAGLKTGDRLLLGPLPASSLFLNAKVHLDKSLGATGIFNLGYLANGVDAEDTDAFVTGADGGGQSALAETDKDSAGLYKRFSKETFLVLICTEDMDDAVLDAVVTIETEYVND